MFNNRLLYANKNTAGSIDPFGTKFDITKIWASIIGRKV